jgi:hypothetical protein
MSCGTRRPLRTHSSHHGLISGGWFNWAGCCRADPPTRRLQLSRGLRRRLLGLKCRADYADHPAESDLDRTRAGYAAGPIPGSSGLESRRPRARAGLESRRPSTLLEVWFKLSFSLYSPYFFIFSLLWSKRLARFFVAFLVFPSSS